MDGPTANYVTPMFAPQLPSINWQELRRAQNNSLCIIIVFYNPTSEDQHPPYHRDARCLVCLEMSSPATQPLPPRIITKTVVARYKDTQVTRYRGLVEASSFGEELPSERVFCLLVGLRHLNNCSVTLRGHVTVVTMFTRIALM